MVLQKKYGTSTVSSWGASGKGEPHAKHFTLWRCWSRSGSWLAIPSFKLIWRGCQPGIGMIIWDYGTRPVMLLDIRRVKYLGTLAWHLCYYDRQALPISMSLVPNSAKIRYCINMTTLEWLFIGVFVRRVVFYGSNAVDTVGPWPGVGSWSETVLSERSWHLAGVLEDFIYKLVGSSTSWVLIITTFKLLQWPFNSPSFFSPSAPVAATTLYSRSNT